jgi:hypothetical protein
LIKYCTFYSNYSFRILTKQFQVNKCWQSCNGYYWPGETLLELWRQQRDQQQLTAVASRPAGRPPRLAAIGKSVSMSPYSGEEDYEDAMRVEEEGRRSSMAVGRLSHHNSMDMRDQQQIHSSHSSGIEVQQQQQKLLLSSPAVVRAIVGRHHSMDIRAYHCPGGEDDAAEGGGGTGWRHYSMDMRSTVEQNLELSRRPQSLPDNFRTGMLADQLDNREMLFLVLKNSMPLNLKKTFFLRSFFLNAAILDFFNSCVMSYTNIISSF